MPAPRPREYWNGKDYTDPMIKRFFNALLHDRLALVLFTGAIIMLTLLGISEFGGKDKEKTEENGALLPIESVAAAENPETMDYGDSAAFGNLEITVEGVYYADAVRPVNRHGTFAYLKAMETQQYLVLTGMIKNNSDTAWPKKLYCGTFWLDNDTENAYRTVFLVETLEDGFVDELAAGTEQKFTLVTTVNNETLETMKSCTVQLGLCAAGDAAPNGFADCDFVLQVEAGMGKGSKNAITLLEETDATEASEKTKWNGME